MASEQFSLCWDNFHKNMSSGMHSLLETEDLVDVTLAVEGKYLKAHKMVLSVCSPYFRNLFKSNPCKHPIVFMKDVSYSALTDLLQFMYQGEVQVNQENLSTFIKTAEALQIKGLTGDGNSSEDITENNHEETKQQTAPSPQAKRTSREAEDTKSPRIKRPFGPASKRAKVSSVTSVEIKTPSKVDSKSTEETVQFKMEPYESGANVQGGQDDTFGDDPLEDSQADDADDYSVMEGSEEEPQAGTSGDAVGEGQGPYKFIIADNTKYLVLNQHIYGFREVLNNENLWGCAFNKSCAAKCYVKNGKIKRRQGTHSHKPPNKYISSQEAKGKVLYKKLIKSS